MSKIVSMSSGAIDPINVTKRVFWRPVTAATVLKVGQPVCYNSDCVCDHKERTADPTHIGLAEDTYAEGEQEFTGRLFIVEEPLTANLMSFAGIVKSLGPKAGADGDMIEIFTPVDGAVVPVYADQYCYADRTIMGIRNAEADVSYPGIPIGIALEDKDRSGTAGLVWMRFRKFQYDNQNEALQIEDECGSDCLVNTINITTAQTAGRISGLEIKVAATSTGGSHAYGYGMALYAETSISGVQASHITNAGFWLNMTGGIQGDIHASVVEIGLYEDGATLTSIANLAVLKLTHQVADAPQANCFNWIQLTEDGAETADNFIRIKDKADFPAVAFTGSTTINTDSYGIKVYLSAAGQTWYIPLIPKLED